MRDLDDHTYVGGYLLAYADELVELLEKRGRWASAPTWADMPKPWRPEGEVWDRWVADMGLRATLDHYAMVRPDRGLDSMKTGGP